jgi:hypothetical protein
MKKMFKRINFFIFLIACSTFAKAEGSKFYVEGSYAHLTEEKTDFAFFPSVARIMLGAQIHDNLALEACGMVGMSSQEMFRTYSRLPLLKKPKFRKGGSILDP